MSWNKSPLAFEDVRDTLERAMNTPKGIRIACSSRSEAINTRSRFNYFRKLDRLDNKATYPEGHRLHGTSLYDSLVLRILKKGDKDDRYLYIEHRTAEDYKVEELE